MFKQTYHWLAIAQKNNRGGSDEPTLIRTQDWNTYYFGDSGYRGIGLQGKIDSGEWFIQSDFGLLDDREAEDQYRLMMYKMMRSAELSGFDSNSIVGEHHANPFIHPADLAGVIKPDGKLVLPSHSSDIGTINILIVKELPFDEWKRRTAAKEDLFKWLFAQNYIRISPSGDILYNQAGGNVGAYGSSITNSYTPFVLSQGQYQMLLSISWIFYNIKAAHEAEKIKTQAEYLLERFG